MSEGSVSLKEFYEAKIAGLHQLLDANDRRYTEVNIEKEKALRIKEEADKVALSLARDIQNYKDEKANELREQINSERGLYASKHDVELSVEKLELLIKPLADYVTAQNGRSKGLSTGWTFMVTAIGLVATLLVIYSFIR